MINDLPVKPLLTGAFAFVTFLSLSEISSYAGYEPTHATRAVIVAIIACMLLLQSRYSKRAVVGKNDNE